MGSNPATPTKKPPEKDFLRRGSKKREISYGEKYCSGCSAVRLARQLRELEVAGSNPVSPTNRQTAHEVVCFFLFYDRCFGV